MKIGIAGIGLIGGSFAKAYKAKGHQVYVYDRSEITEQYAILSQTADGILSAETIPDCDLILIALYPTDTITYMTEIAPLVSPHTLVMDCCGTKRSVCREGFALAERYGFTYAGGHPMAGTQFSGFKNSREDMFQGAPMVVVPPVHDDIYFLQRVKDMLAPAGFGRISVSTAEQHDRVIAFTSQLAHVVSNAYVKSPSATDHHGCSAGSYRDLTRVARLNEQMWADLFLENSDNLLRELDSLIRSLDEYRAAISAGDRERLTELLAEGRRRKEQVDGV